MTTQSGPYYVKSKPELQPFEPKDLLTRSAVEGLLPLNTYQVMPTDVFARYIGHDLSSKSEMCIAAASITASVGSLCLHMLRSDGDMIDHQPLAFALYQNEPARTAAIVHHWYGRSNRPEDYDAGIAASGTQAFVEYRDAFALSSTNGSLVELRGSFYDLTHRFMERSVLRSAGLSDEAEFEVVLKRIGFDSYRRNPP